MSITSDYFKGSSIYNNDTKAIMDFISSAESVNKMIVASDMGLPALTPIVEELENKFKNSNLSPLHHNGKNKNAVHRQNVGRMIKYVMAQFGYIPIDGGLSERARIPKFANSQYFYTAAIYRKLKQPKYNIDLKIITTDLP